MSKPNVLYLHCHDTGRCIQPYGYPVATPNLQALANDAVLFRQCFCTGPTCSPSRSALLTGMYPHNNGMLGLAHRGFTLNDPSQHMAQYLADQAGYHPALCGTQHVIPHEKSRDLGYQSLIPPEPCEERPDDHYAPVAKGAARWLRSEAAREAPFFLSVGFGKPHLYKGPADDPRWVAPPPGLPDAPPTREHAARTHAGIAAMDRAMGQVLDSLASAGLADNTVVMCTTDHGLAFPRRKCTLSDGGLGVFAIWRGPFAELRGGRVVDPLVAHMDFYPTLMALLEIDAPDWLQGKSMLPLLRGECQRLHDELFSEITYHAAYQPERGIRTERWKYIRRFDHRRRMVLPNVDDSPSKRYLVNHDWFAEERPEEALYDLVLDPLEQHNIVDAPGSAPLAELRARLDAWMIETEDPIRDGFVRPPVAATTTDVDEQAPSTWVWERRE